MPIGDFGQPRLEKLFDEMLERGRVAGSFLFEGPLGVGKEALALELGRLVNCELGGRCPAKAPFTRAAKAVAAKRCDSCHKFDILQHPDLLLVFPVPKDTWDEPTPRGRGDEVRLTTIGQILRDKAHDPYYRRQDFERPVNIEADVLRDRVLPKVYSRPVEARFKVIVISDAEIMANNIGNVLLKTLEEPPENCLIVLASSVPQRLLPTILSRCQRIRFTPLDPDWMEPRLVQLYGKTQLQARLAAAVSQGSMLAAARFLDGDLEAVRDLAFDVLRTAAAGDELELLEVADRLGHEHPKNRRQVPVFLQMLVAAARDALLVQSGAAGVAPRGKSAGPRLVNVDRAAQLGELVRALGDEGLQRVIRDSEATDRQIAGNAAVEPALASLLLGLVPAESIAAAPRTRR